MSLKTHSFRRKLANALKKAPVTVSVYRKNEEGESSQDEIFVSEILGHFYKPRKRHIPFSFNDLGMNTTRHFDKFITVVDENSQNIKVWDYFRHQGITYQITDLGEYFDVYMDFSLERTEC